MRLSGLLAIVLTAAIGYNMSHEFAPASRRRTRSFTSLFDQRAGSSYSPNSAPAGSAKTANAPMPGPISFRGWPPEGGPYDRVTIRPPELSISFNVSAMLSTMM